MVDVLLEYIHFQSYFLVSIMLDAFSYVAIYMLKINWHNQLVHNAHSLCFPMITGLLFWN